jgi:osmotically-inducible protein OsmY
MGLLLAGPTLAADQKSKTTKAKEKVADVAKEINEDINEAVLASKIRVAMLKSLKGADALRVVIGVKGTSATLTGEVEDRASVKVAEETAKSVEGVTTVHSSIKHNPKAAHQENFESNVKDSILVAEVRLRLLQEVGKAALKVHVTATDGVVSLRGEMPDSATRTQALEKVKAMDNVKRVEDLMSSP